MRIIFNVKKVLILMAYVLLIYLPLSASSSERACSLIASGSIAEPRLLYPIKDTVVLTGDFLEFKWLNDPIWVRTYILKLYKGYNMYSQYLIHSEIVSSDIASLKVDTALFQDNAVYTWSLAAVSLNGAKSDKSYNSFKVEKNYN